MRLAERLEFDITRDLGLPLPRLRGVPPRRDRPDALAAPLLVPARRALPGARKRHAARERLDEELALIAHHDLAGFFLLHRDILELAREVALRRARPGRRGAGCRPGAGAASSVGSIVCFLTGLSHVDPVENGLFLGRFLNRDMASVPDIDLDFPRDVRELLIEEVIGRYGAEHAALVAAFPTFRIRMAIRELGGALALPEADLERLTRLSDGWSSARAVEEELARLPDGEAKLASPRWRALAAPRARGRGPAATPVPALRGHGGERAPAGGAGAAWCPPPSRAGRSASGTRTPAPTPASSRSTSSASGCCRPSRSAST